VTIKKMEKRSKKEVCDESEENRKRLIEFQII
jgi:hypothetical protein